MSCGCAGRARRAFEADGYTLEGDYYVKGDDRVHKDDIQDHHLVRTLERPSVTKEAVKVIAQDLWATLGG